MNNIMLESAESLCWSCLCPARVRTVNVQSFDNHKTSASHGLHFGRTPTVHWPTESTTAHLPTASLVAVLTGVDHGGREFLCRRIACGPATDRKGAPVFRETMSEMRVVARADLHQRYTQIQWLVSQPRLPSACSNTATPISHQYRQTRRGTGGVVL